MLGEGSAPGKSTLAQRRATMAAEMRRCLALLEHCVTNLVGGTPDTVYRDRLAEMRRTEQQYREARKLWRHLLDRERTEEVTR